jgi:hypothetical protein
VICKCFTRNLQPTLIPPAIVRHVTVNSKRITIMRIICCRELSRSEKGAGRGDLSDHQYGVLLNIASKPTYKLGIPAIDDKH